jgi:hypothetical protein
LPIWFHPFIFFIIRWNSLHLILERFDKVKNCILKSLIDLGSSITLDEEELNLIHHLVTTLEPVKLAAEALCRRDATLLSADTTISFMIYNLGNSDLAVQLKESFLRRMNQRRTKFSSLLQYLHKGNQTYAELELDPLLNFEHLSKATIVSMVTGISKPLDQNKPFELESDNETAKVEIDLKLSMQEKLARAIDKEMNSKIYSKSRRAKDVMGILKNELANLEVEGKHGANLLI